MQVIATYNGQEISSGEGEGYRYAIEDCIDNMPEIFKADRETARWVDLEFVDAPAGAMLSTRPLTDYLYQARQYF